MGKLEADTLRYLVGKGTAGVGVFLAVPLVSRQLGEDRYGAFSLWMGLVLLVGGACTSWLQASVLRFFRDARVDGREAEFGATARVLAIGSAVLAAVLAFGALTLFGGLPIVDRLAFAGVAAAVVASTVGLAFAQADLRARDVAIADTIRGLSMVIVLAVCSWISTLTIASACLGHALGFVASAIVVSIRAPASARERGAASWSIARRFAGFGLPMSLWTLLTMANGILARPFLEAEGLHADLGRYGAIQDLVTKAGTLAFVPLVTSLHGHVMASWAERDLARLRSAIRRSTLYTAVGGLLLVGGATAASGLLHAMLFGRPPTDARETAVLVGLVTIAIVLANLGNVAHKLLEVAEQTRTMTLVMAAAIAVQAAACAWLVPRHGATGAALALVLAQAGYVGGCGVLSALIGRRLHSARTTHPRSQTR